MELTLFSSDSSTQYKKDIYNVIAAPYNSEYRFRYRTQYIEESLKTQLQNKKLIDERAIVVFRTTSDKPGIKPFMVPIRWVTIKDTYLSDEICIIDFIIQEYPQFVQNFKEAVISLENNQKYSESFFEKKASHEMYVLPFAIDAASREKYDYEHQESAWISIVEALKHYEPFKNTSFFRTLLPSESKNEFASQMTIKDREYKQIEIWHFCSEDSDAKSSCVSIQCDSNYLNSISGNSDRIECRYDKINYDFQAVNGRSKIRSNITFRIYTLDEEQNPDYKSETKIVVPVKLKRRWGKRILRTGLSFLGGCVCQVKMLAKGPQKC